MSSTTSAACRTTRNYDEAGIKEKTGVTPELYPQYAALRGDPSDNLPGVPGVGEKTAAKLINEYGGIDGIFENLDKLTPKLRENLAAREDAVRANAEVIPLIRDVELPELDPDAIQWGGWDEKEVRDLFAFLEFRGPIERLIEAFGADGRGSAAAAAAGSDRRAHHRQDRSRSRDRRRRVGGMQDLHRRRRRRGRLGRPPRPQRSARARARRARRLPTPPCGSPRARSATRNRSPRSTNSSNGR